MTYYGRFYRSQLYPFLARINTYLMRWARKKYKRLHAFKTLQGVWTGLVRFESQGLFRHWHGREVLKIRDEKSGMTGLSRPVPWSPGVRFPRATPTGFGYWYVAVHTVSVDLGKRVRRVPVPEPIACAHLDGRDWVTGSRASI
jgi:hypothetical protein